VTRLNAHLLEPSERAVIDHLLARGEPQSRQDLARAFSGRLITRLEEAGHLFQAMDRGLFPTPLTIRELNAYAPWSPADEAELRRLWTGADTISDIATHFGRTGGDVIQHAWAMRLERRTAVTSFEVTPAWRIRRLRIALAEAERRGLVEGDDGSDLTHRAFRRRFEAGRAMAASRARHYDVWSRDDLALLRTMRDDGASIPRIAQLLRRTVAAVSSKVHELGIAVDRSWTMAEDEIVAAGVAARLTCKEISARLDGKRTQPAIKCRINVLGLSGVRKYRPWTDAERESLRAAVLSGDSIAAWCRKNGRSESAAQYQRVLMGVLHRDNTLTKVYSEAENERIRQGYAAKESASAIAAELGRPLKSLYCQAFKLGVTGDNSEFRRRVRPDEVETVRRMAAAGAAGCDIASAIGRTLMATYRLANRNGIAIGNGQTRHRRRARMAAE